MNDQIRIGVTAIGAVAGALLSMSSAAQAVPIINDDFTGGIPLGTYKEIGSASLELDDTSDPMNPRLLVRMNNTGDGVRINIPSVDLMGDPTSATCFRMLQDIEPDSLMPQGFAWEHTVEMVDVNDDMVEFVFTATRSFWNRCKYKFEVKGQAAVVEGFLNHVGEAPAVKIGCPAATDVRFDWSKIDGIEYIEIEIIAGKFAAEEFKGKFHTKKKAPAGFKHFPGDGNPQQPGEYRITAYKVTVVKEKTKPKGKKQ